MTKIVTHDSEIKALGQQVITACAFIHHNFDGVEKLFLAKRAATKKFLPGVFELPGGHIDFGESIEIGLKREIQEELKVEVNLGDPFYVFTYTNEIKGSHSIEVIYFAKLISPLENITIQVEDHSEYKWVTENELNDVINNGKLADDPEFKGIRKGFSLLKGNITSLG